MAKDASFDVYSEVDMQEVNNAVNQANKEISQRYDFKDSKAEITVENDGLKILAEDEYKLKSVIEVLKNKMVSRKVPLKNLNYQTIEAASGGTVRQIVKILSGIEQEKAKAIVKDIKASGIKVQAQINGEIVRVSGKNRDDLQEVIQLLKGKDYGIELLYGNYR